MGTRPHWAPCILRGTPVALYCARAAKGTDVTEDSAISLQAEELRQLMRAKLGVRGGTFQGALKRGAPQLPRHLRRQAQVVVDALPMAVHPKLRQTLDRPRLDRAVADLRRYLDDIDLADRRKGFVLGVLGAMAFNLLALIALLIVFLVWKGFV